MISKYQVVNLYLDFLIKADQSGEVISSDQTWQDTPISFDVEGTNMKPFAPHNLNWGGPIIIQVGSIDSAIVFVCVLRIF